MAVIIVMFPLPGYLAKRLQGVQATKMKKVCFKLLEHCLATKFLAQTDVRVQNVTECTLCYNLLCINGLAHINLAMGVIRMIKVCPLVAEIVGKLRFHVQLFGWEPKVNAQVAEKREDELKSIRRFKMLEMVNGIVR
jgi:hypothetical protein